MIRALLQTALSRHDGYGDPTVLRVRADTLRVGDRIEGGFTVDDVKAVMLASKWPPLIFAYDRMGVAEIFEGDEWVPIRLAGGAS